MHRIACLLIVLTAISLWPVQAQSPDSQHSYIRQTLAPSGSYSKVALTSSGVPVVAYAQITFPGSQPNMGVQLAQCESVACATPISTVVDPNGLAGYDLQMVLDDADRPQLVYGAETGVNNELRYTACDNTACANPTVRQLEFAVGLYPHIDWLGNGPVMSHYSSTVRDFFITTCGQTCDTFVRNEVDVFDLNPFHIMQADSQGRPVLLNTRTVTSATLRLTRCSDSVCSNYSTQELLTLDPTATLFDLGMALGPDDHARIFYTILTARGGDVPSFHVLTCTNLSCSSFQETILPRGFIRTTITVDSANRPQLLHVNASDCCGPPFSEVLLSSCSDALCTSLLTRTLFSDDVLYGDFDLTLTADDRPVIVGAAPALQLIQCTREGCRAIPGDCNFDGPRDAADLSALFLELNDGDGSDAAQAAEGSFRGDADGCDPTGDGVIDLADLACVRDLIFNPVATCAIS